MLNNIELLINLQNTDKSIKKLELEKKEIPNLINQSEQKINNANQILENAKKTLTDKQLEKKELELELAKTEENIKKFNIEMNSIKSNDKYKALLEVIINEKQKKSDIEDKILADFDDVDVMTASLNKEKETLKILEQELESKKTELNEKIKNIETEIQKLIAEREIIIKNINDNTIISLYDKIRAHQSGIGISEVNTETSSCSSCNMYLPFQKINDIMSSKQPVLCENCSKILYIIKK